MAIEPNPYRLKWAQWLPAALPLLEQENYREALADFPKPDHTALPFHRLSEPPRMAIVTSSGAYDRETQTPFVAHSAIGDLTHRMFPLDLADERIAFSHGHYNPAAAMEDREVILPRRALQAEGAALTPTVISYMGYMLDWPSFIEQTVPQIVRQVSRDGANCALLVPV